MVFKKIGDATVEKVMCPCGGEIKNGKCNKCSKEHRPSEKKDEKEKRNG
jgi:hypothetical protein